MSRWENKVVIGLTGNIAVGKSVVRQMLQHLGAYTIDADGLSHQAMAPGAPAYKPIIELFGKIVVDEDGRINRTRLGAFAFAFPEALTALETIIHPVVQQAAQVLIARAKQPVIVIEAIKLLEGNLINMVDTVWVVDSSQETQYRRLIEKRKMSQDDARRRVMIQGPQGDKLKQAQVVIKNDGSVEDTWRQVQTAWEEMQRLNAPPAPAVVAAAVAPAPVAPIRPIQPATANRPPAAASVAASVPAAASAPSAQTFDLKTEVVIKRGMPNNAEDIATFVSKVSSRKVSRMDIMLAFGQKSFLLAYGKNNWLIGVVGWQVENLITRIDEFYVTPEVPKGEIIAELITAAEEASKDLQSEVSFVVMPRHLGGDVVPSLSRRAYTPLKLAEIRFPAWREAAQDMLTVQNADILIKQLRADRVMKPI